MVRPKPINGAGSCRVFISCCNTLASSLESPPPPYWDGHSGAVQPRSAMTSSQTFISGFEYLALRPPQFPSSRVFPTPRIEAGAFCVQPLMCLSTERFEIGHVRSSSIDKGDPTVALTQSRFRVYPLLGGGPKGRGGFSHERGLGAYAAASAGMFSGSGSWSGSVSHFLSSGRTCLAKHFILPSASS